MGTLEFFIFLKAHCIFRSREEKGDVFHNPSRWLISIAIDYANFENHRSD